MTVAAISDQAGAVIDCRIILFYKGTKMADRDDKKPLFFQCDDAFFCNIDLWKSLALFCFLSGFC